MLPCARVYASACVRVRVHICVCVRVSVFASVGVVSLFKCDELYEEEKREQTVSNFILLFHPQRSHPKLLGKRINDPLVIRQLVCGNTVSLSLCVCVCVSVRV